MNHRIRAFFGFGHQLLRYVLYIREVLVGLLVLIFVGGVAIAKVEGLKLGDAIYFSCITGLTIGYGDISPETTWGRVLSVAIGMVGMVFTGLVVAVATRALRDFVQYEQEHKH